MLESNNTALIVIDVQPKLFDVMYEKDELFRNIQLLIKAIRILELPIIATEQYPEGLGSTLPALSSLFPDVTPVRKLSFSCWGSEPCSRQIEQTGRKQILLAGIETHVCVYQTAMELLASGFEVQVVADAVSSRTVKNREIGLQKMRDEGARSTSVETALFELLRSAAAPKFRELSRIIK